MSLRRTAPGEACGGAVRTRAGEDRESFRLLAHDTVPIAVVHVPVRGMRPVDRCDPVPACWMPHERNGILRSWWADVPPANVEAELAWLAEVYRQSGRILNRVELPRHDITACDRWRADPIELRS